MSARASHLMCLLTLLASGCRWEPGKLGGPDFQRFSREHAFDVKQATHRAGDLELQVLSASVTEVYTVIGSENWTAHIRVRLKNVGTQPLSMDMNSVGAIRPRSGSVTAVYFHPVDLPAGGEADAQFNVPAGVTRSENPLALVYRGVRMDLQ